MPLVAFLYTIVVLAIIIYMVWLFIRFVNAVEKIANSVENYCKSR